MKFELEGRCVKIDQYGKLHILSCNDDKYNNLLRFMSEIPGSKPYFNCVGGRGFIAKPYKNILVKTFDGEIRPLSQQLLGRNLVMRVITKKYKFGDKMGISLSITSMYEQGYDSDYTTGKHYEI